MGSCVIAERLGYSKFNVFLPLSAVYLASAKSFLGESVEYTSLGCSAGFTYNLLDAHMY